MYLLGYIPRDNRMYLGDKELNIVSYSLQLAVLEYQTAIMRKDFDTADKVSLGDSSMEELKCIFSPILCKGGVVPDNTCRCYRPFLMTNARESLTSWRSRASSSRLSLCPLTLTTSEHHVTVM